MLRRVRAQLEVHGSDPDQPERATLTLTRTLLSGFPRQRPVTLALVGFAPHPGLTPTPWGLDGVLEACVEAERTPVQLLTLADADTDEALLRKAGRTLVAGADGRELVERPSRDRLLSLRSPDQPRPFAVPRELVGSSLLLVTPLLLRAHDQGRARHWHGPLTLALEQLALAWGYRRAPAKLSAGLRAPVSDEGRAAAAAGLGLIAASFANAAILIDGTWAGAVEAPPSTSVRSLGGLDWTGPRRALGSTGPGRALGSTAEAPSLAPRLLGELDSSDRCLAVAELHRLGLDAVLGVDQWLSKALGLELGAAARGHAHAAPILGERSPGRWPQLQIGPRSQPTRLADRAIAGIRSQSQRLASTVIGGGGTREALALPARVPGRFAQQWTSRWYGELERLER
jgi:hypothetical protein